MRFGYGCWNFRSGLLSRRELLRVGGLGFLGLNLAELFRAEAAGAAELPARA